MSYLEKPLIFECEGDTLLGILAQPRRQGSTGVVVVVGGPQYRAGSHRQFVLLGRALAAAGYPSLRFDFRGMGDSGGEPRGFEASEQDIGAAISALRAASPSVGRVVLWGLCDGASAALLYWHRTRDPRVDGFVLVNPWVRSEASLARTRIKHYYSRRLLEADFWKKAFRGKLAVGDSLRGLAAGLRAFLTRRAAPVVDAGMPFQRGMAAAWRHFGGDILLALSGQDYVAREFLEYTRSDPAWAGLLERASVRRLDFPEADHTFSRSGPRLELELATLEWLRKRERREHRLAG